MELPEIIEQGRQRIHTAIADSAESVGPGVINDDLDPEPTPPLMLSSWVMVVCWVDNDGNAYLTKMVSENQLDHQAKGLLHTALHEME